MAKLEMTQDQYRRLIALLAERRELLTPTDRVNFVERAGLTRFEKDLNFDVNRTSFSQQLVRRLQDYGTFNGEPAIMPLLRELRTLIEGQEDSRDFIDGLLLLHVPPAAPASTPPAPTGTAYLFISYSSKDRSFVKRAAEDLQQAGVRVWWDRQDGEGIQIAQNWERVLRAKLQEITHLAAMITPRYLASDMCLAELLVAQSLGKALIPVYVEALPNGQTMPLPLVPLQYVDFRDPAVYAARITELARTLNP